MNGYLLDTSICVFLFRDKYNVAERLNNIGAENCYISDVTIAELRYGAYKSERTDDNLALIEELEKTLNVVPFRESVNIYAKEKNRLRQLGTPIEDFDLLIASAAIARNITLVTDNTKHFARVQNLKLENWIER